MDLQTLYIVLAKKDTEDLPQSVAEIAQQHPKIYEYITPEDAARMRSFVCSMRSLSFNKETGKLERRGDLLYYEYFLDETRIPSVEREYLADLNELAKLNRPKLRPVEPLTREQCNTRDGRCKLVSWVSGYPQILLRHNYRDERDEMIYLRDLNHTLQSRFGSDTDWPLWKNAVVYNNNGSDVARYINHDDNDLYTFSDADKTKYDGLFYRSDDGGTMITRNPIGREQFPDMAFAVDLDTEILTRDEFIQAAEKIAPVSAIPALLEKYDYTQYYVDALFATYELFRTEKYESIANCSPMAQRAAIRNYFATFWSYGERSKPKAKAETEAETDDRDETPETLHYIKPKYVVSNMAKAMGIPPEAMANAKRNISGLRWFVREGRQQGTPQEQTTSILSDKKANGIRSKEADRQRTETDANKFPSRSLQLDFFEYLYGNVKIDNVVFDDKQLREFIVSDTARRKLFNELIYTITTAPSFKVEEYARRVSSVSKREDLGAIHNDTTFEFDATEIIRNLFGKVSPDNIKAFEAMIEALPKEPFVFYRQIVKKDKEGNEIIIHIDRNSKKKYPKEISELLYVERRFTFISWVAEKNGKGTHLFCNIRANPIMLANMLDNRGGLTNYDLLTPRYMEYSRAIRNDDRITPSVEKILGLERSRRFKAATEITKRSKSKAKAIGEKLTAEDIANIRTKTFQILVPKDKLFAAVLLNAGEPNELEPYKRKRIEDKIEQAFRTLIEYGVILQGVKSIEREIDDGKVAKYWDISFLEPSK